MNADQQQARLEEAFERIEETILPCIAMMLETLLDASAGLAERLLRRADGRFELRPRPHQFAAFHVLRRAETPAVLVEAGYISNAEDEARLMTREGRAPLVLALAQAVEADLATRGRQ